MSKVFSDTNLVVGAGVSGATLARLLAQRGESVLVIDKRPHVAGNCFDYFEKNICVHKYGSHIFHTNDEGVWAFLSRFSDFNNYKHKVLASIDGVETNIPFNLNTLYALFEQKKAEVLEQKLLQSFPKGSKVSVLDFQDQKDEDLACLANYIYEKVFLGYTTKQWGLSPKEVDPLTIARVPVYISRDDGYFQDKYQGIPKEGYTKMVENILSHKNIELCLNTDYKDLSGKFKRVFYTGSADEFFNYKHGTLPYRSVSFELEKHRIPFYQKNAVINYPNDHEWTRVHEYKYYLNDASEFTIVAKEFSSDFELGRNERFYPVQNRETLKIYEKYENEAKLLENTYFLGRLGDYKYYDMDKAVKRALELFDKL